MTPLLQALLVTSASFLLHVCVSSLVLPRLAALQHAPSRIATSYAAVGFTAILHLFLFLPLAIPSFAISTAYLRRRGPVHQQAEK